MKYRVLFMLALVVSATLALSSTVVASEEHQARKMCKSKITEVYGVDRFSDLLTDKLGNHKFKVQGKVRVHNHMYPFKCKIKNGHVKSYAYNGPHDRHPEHNYHDDDDDSNVGAAIAVGAGLAIIAAIASQSGDDHQDKSDISTSQSVLEDDCHDMLQYRIRDEHDATATVRMKSSHMSGRDLKGDIKVKYLRRNDQRGSYTCHFNSSGRLLDSSYHLY
jgi:hypothetical protein